MTESWSSPQGVLRLNGRELLFWEAKGLVASKFTPLANLCNRQASPFGVTPITGWSTWEAV